MSLLLFWQEGGAPPADAIGGAYYQQYYRAVVLGRAMQLELNEATAARRRVPFRVFLSNGTAPDTGVSNDTVMFSVNGAAQISAGSASAVSAAAGMYYVELTQSLCSVLGTHPVWYDLGDFAQHVATVQVVNSNPFSTQSNVTAVGVSGINAGTYSGVTFQGVTRVNSSVTPANALYSAVTFRIDPVDYSGATVGINNATGDVSSRFTVAVAEILGKSYSNVTIQGIANSGLLVTAVTVLDKTGYTIAAGDYSSSVTFGAGRVNSAVTIADANYSAVTTRVTGIVASSFNAGAIDAAALATDAGQEIADRLLLRNIDTGSDSGRSVAQAFSILRNRVDASSSVLTVYQTDDVTSAWTASLTTGAAVSITVLDPL